MTKLFNLNDFYDWLAPYYATAMGLLPMWRRYTEAVLPHLPADGAVLEIGPGPGLLLAQLAGRHPMAAGLDLSAGMLRQARRRLRRAHLPALLSRGDATVLPFGKRRRILREQSPSAVVFQPDDPGQDQGQRR